MRLPHSVAIAARVLFVCVVLVLVWLVIVLAHTLSIVTDRADLKQDLCIPRTVILPSPAEIEQLDADAARLSAVLRLAANQAPRPIFAWILFGTALGAARHGGRIHWDDDFDVGMWREDVPRFASMLASNPSLHLTLDYVLYQHMSSCIKLRDSITGHEVADIFAFTVEEGSSGGSGGARAVLAWDSWHKDEFDRNSATPIAEFAQPLQWVAFGDTFLPALARNDELVETLWYSRAAIETAKVAPPHTWMHFVLWNINPFLTDSFDIPRKCRRR